MSRLGKLLFSIETKYSRLVSAIHEPHRDSSQDTCLSPSVNRLLVLLQDGRWPYMLMALPLGHFCLMLRIKLFVNLGWWSVGSEQWGRGIICWPRYTVNQILLAHLQNTPRASHTALEGLGWNVRHRFLIHHSPFPTKPIIFSFTGLRQWN